MNSLKALMSELHPTSFNNKLSHNNMIEKCSSEHVKKKNRGIKDEKKCKEKRKKKIKQEQ